MARSSPIAIDAADAQLRRRLGQEVSGPPPYLTEATRDAILHWVEAIGDDNPLWLDTAYARTTRWGTSLAPPTMLYAFDHLSIGYRGGLPGVYAMFAGTDCRDQSLSPVNGAMCTIVRHIPHPRSWYAR